MLFFIILVCLILLIFFIFFINKYRTKIKNDNNVNINFEDIDSLNVSKIVKDENDLDFVRNQFWFQYKQKQTINSVCFFKLKKIFEEENNIKISNLSDVNSINDDKDFDLIEIIISEVNTKEEKINAFNLLEKRINHSKN